LNSALTANAPRMGPLLVGFQFPSRGFKCPRLLKTV